MTRADGTAPSSRSPEDVAGAEEAVVQAAIDEAVGVLREREDRVRLALQESR